MCGSFVEEFGKHLTSQHVKRLRSPEKCSHPNEQLVKQLKHLLIAGMIL